VLEELNKSHDVNQVGSVNVENVVDESDFEDPGDTNIASGIREDSISNLKAAQPTNTYANTPDQELAE